MSQTTIKSKYEIKQIISEEILFYIAEGEIKFSKIPILIWQYKNDLLTPKIIERLSSVCEKLIKIEHPNLLKMLDFTYEEGNFYTVFEYPPDLISLSDYLSAGSAMPATEIKKIFFEIISALEILEKNHFIHGYLNLGSIYLTPSSGIKLVNAVLSVIIIKPYIKTLSILDYSVSFAPEFIQRQELSTRSDIYSFGVLMYYLCTNKWPYPDDLDINKLKQSLLKTPTPPSKINSTIPKKLEQIINIAISKEPTARFSSFSSLRESFIGDKLIVPAVEETNIDKTSLEKEIALDLNKTLQKKLLKTLKYLIIYGSLFILSLFLYSIYLDYMTEIPEIKVPQTIGLPEKKALSILKELHLQGKIVGVYSAPGIPNGYISQSLPPGGRSVKQNREIKLFIGDSSANIQVLNLVGRNINQARAIVEQDQILLEITDYQFSNTIPVESIIEQSPTPDNLLKSGDKIMVILSKGFPLSLDIEKNFPNGTSKIKVVFSVLKEWNPQDILIVKNKNRRTEKLYSDVHLPGDNVTKTFAIEKNSTIEIFYNDTLALSEKIQ